MPQVIPVVLAFAQTTVGAFLVNTAISLTLNAVVARLNRPSGPKPQDMQTTVTSGSADRQQHFGRVRTSGALMYADWANVGGDRRAFVLLAVATGGIDAVEQWYLDGKPVTVNADGWVQTAPWQGRVRLRMRTGRGSQFSGGDYADLRSAFPMRWTTAHRLDGVATFLGQFSAVKPENVADVYPGGRPPVISAIVRGAICAPITNEPADFSTNPVRQAYHYLAADGAGTIPRADFDTAIWNAARAECNATVPTAGGTRPRFAAGGSYFLAEPRKDVAARIMESCAGSLYLTPEGKIGVRVGTYQAPTITIERQHIVSMNYGMGRSQLDRVTTLVPQYVEPSLDYTETTADPWEDARAIARFGETKPRELGLPFVQHHGQARALAKIAAARENPQITATLSLRFWGLRLIGQERVFLHRPDRGLNNVPMRIVSLSLDLGASDGVVKVELESDDPAAYAWTAPEEGQKPAAPPRSDVHTLPEIVAPVIAGVAVSQAVISGTVAPATGYIVQVQFRPTGGPWAALEVNQATGFFRTPPLSDGQTYEVRGRWVLSGLAATAVETSDLTRWGPWTTLTGIVAVANGTPPAEPVLISASRSGNTITIVFEPDLGANYAQTGIWRGPTFAGATFVKWVRDQSSTVTTTIQNAPAPETYWLRSGNGSGITSAPVNIGTL
ncbi:hypothetical protein [Paracoccus sp. (in: a-proteobacteria)]|uniref:hypothetical protein n=1 Tax=Paracoccus sp. TaxID=267 RepID=UPI00272DB09A|nr:hypothetical protein [Paracoccus sp. (in: a-proteobacteria)]